MAKLKTLSRLNNSYRVRSALMVFYTLILVFNIISIVVYYHWSLIMVVGLSAACYAQLLIDYVIDRNDGKFY